MAPAKAGVFSPRLNPRRRDIHSLFKASALGAMRMNGMTRLVSIALMALALAAPASAQRRGDQYRAYEARQAGQVLSLREIEGRVLPQMRGSTYLGPEFDGSVYRLKFMRSGSVMWVDVDARTGAVIGRSGF